MCLLLKEQGDPSNIDTFCQCSLLNSNGTICMYLRYYIWAIVLSVSLAEDTIFLEHYFLSNGIIMFYPTQVFMHVILIN